MCARQYLFIFARTRPFKQQFIEVVINQTSAQHSTTLSGCQSVCNKFVRYEQKMPTIFSGMLWHKLWQLVRKFQETEV